LFQVGVEIPDLGTNVPERLAVGIIRNITKTFSTLHHQSLYPIEQINTITTKTYPRQYSFSTQYNIITFKKPNRLNRSISSGGKYSIVSEKAFLFLHALIRRSDARHALDSGQHF